MRKAVGDKPSQIKKWLGIAELPPPIKNEIDAHRLSPDAGLQLFRLDDRDAQISLAGRAVREEWTNQKVKEEVTRIINAGEIDERKGLSAVAPLVSGLRSRNNSSTTSLLDEPESGTRRASPGSNSNGTSPVRIALSGKRTVLLYLPADARSDADQRQTLLDALEKCPTEGPSGTAPKKKAAKRKKAKSTSKRKEVSPKKKKAKTKRRQ